MTRTVAIDFNVSLRLQRRALPPDGRRTDQKVAMGSTRRHRAYRNRQRAPEAPLAVSTVRK